MRKLTLVAAACAALAGPALADLTVLSTEYRTGAYAANGSQFADGYQDYFTLINERDGGVGGQKINFVSCETAYNTEQGVECYEKNKGLNPLVIQPLSTGITYQLIPKVSADNIPMHTMGYGRTSAVNGKVFEWVFNYPGTYWDSASVIVKHILDQEGGDLNGKTIALVYHNSAFGKEPIRTLEKLGEIHGFSLSLLPVDHPGQEQKSTWLQIRRDRPDYVVMWGWGVMNQVAVQEAASIRFPMDHFIGGWWSVAEADMGPDERSDGYKAVNFHGVGDDYPLFDDLRKYVVDAGKAAGEGANVGNVLYNRGMVAAMLAVEAMRKAQEIHGVAEITPAQMRDGMEMLSVDEARLEELGLPKFIAPLNVTCADHGGSGQGLIQQWDAKAKTWNIVTDYIAPNEEVIAPLVEEDSAAFAAEAGIEPRACN